MTCGATRRTNLGLAAAFGALVLAAPGCGDRAHMTESHGRAYRETVARQAANPNAGRERREVRGLDAQEAHIIAGTYRRHLTPKSAVAPTQERPMLILTAPQRRDEGGNMPPPSVPTER